MIIFEKRLQSKQTGNDQELMESYLIALPHNQMGKKRARKLINFHDRYAR